MKTSLRRRMNIKAEVATLDYNTSKNYLADEDVHWSNIYSNLSGMPQDFITELTNSLENYNQDTSLYTGEHPETICSNWLNNPSLRELLSPQQLTNINMMYVPEIRQITTLY